MASIARILLAVAILVGGAVAVDRMLLDGRLLGSPEHTTAPACAPPVTFHIGDIDDGFDVDRYELRQALVAAAAMWDDTTQANLFREHRDAGMAVNLVFDERQAAAEQRANEQQTLSRREQELADRETELERRRRRFEEAMAELERRRETYEQRVREHEDAVEAWNAGRVERTPEGRARLEERGEELQRMRQQLEERHETLQERRSELQAEREELMAAMDEHNQQVSAYNKEAASASGFEMGRYEHEDGERSISVFKALNPDELRLVLAHELGHALGITHVDDPGAVMNADLGAANAGRERIAPADREALAARCDVTVDGT